MQFLGLQNAPRKFRLPSQDQTGAWAGTIFRIDSGSVSRTVSLENWSKGRDILRKLQDSLTNCDCPELDRKESERQTGFLNHLAMTFEDFNPFLKGCYLTLNSWRSGRDDEGWRIPNKIWGRLMVVAHFEEDQISQHGLEVALDSLEDPKAPRFVRVCPRFKDVVAATMSQMLSPSSPPVVKLRTKSIVTVIYGFSDASGSEGLGSTFTCGSGFTFRIGIWGADDTSQTSNWKEFCNIVSSLEDEAKEGNLSNSEVFMLTDNSTVKSCCTRGTSSSPKLLSLVIQLQSLTTKYGIKISVFHVSGTRMIAQRTDGVSQGFLGGGVMAGEAMATFIPIHLGTTDRYHPLEEWIKSLSTSELSLLQPSDWFQKGHDIDGWDHCHDGFSRPILRKSRF